MKLFSLFMLFAILQSCSNNPDQKEPFKSLLQNCDEVNINFYNGGDTIHFQTKDSLGIKYLSQNITGINETLGDTCKPVGNLFYRSKGDTLFRAEFAVLPSASKNDCGYISYNYQNSPYKNKLSEKIYQLLSQMYPKPSTDTITQAIDTIQTFKDSLNQPGDSTKK